MIETVKQYETSHSEIDANVPLSIFSLDLESQTQVNMVKTQFTSDANKTHENMNFIPIDTPLTTDLIKTEQKLDNVLSQVSEWLKDNEKPSLKDPNYQSRAFKNYINNFELLFIDPETELICYSNQSDDSETER